MSTEELPPEFEALVSESQPPARAIPLALTFEQMSLLLAVLGNAPYNQVAALVEVIRQQAGAEFERQSLMEQFAVLRPDELGRA